MKNFQVLPELEKAMFRLCGFAQGRLIKNRWAGNERPSVLNDQEGEYGLFPDKYT